MENEERNTLTEASRNESQLTDFSDYCRANPELRFWQALRAWSGYHKILACEFGGKPLDTFTWEGRTNTHETVPSLLTEEEAQLVIGAIPLQALPNNDTREVGHRSNDGSKVVRSKDVMEALSNVFDSVKHQTLPVSEVGYLVYQKLLAVPEFYSADLQSTASDPQIALGGNDPSDVSQGGQEAECVEGEPMMHGPKPYRWCATHNDLMLVCDSKRSADYVAGVEAAIKTICAAKWEGAGNSYIAFMVDRLRALLPTERPAHRM